MQSILIGALEKSRVDKMTSWFLELILRAPLSSPPQQLPLRSPAIPIWYQLCRSSGKSELCDLG